MIQAIASSLRAVGVHKRLGRRTLWSNISFRLEPGVLATIGGPSGAGKTTLLNCLGGLESVDGGQIFWGDLEVGRLSRHARQEYLRTSVGFLFQNYGLIDNWTVERNLDVGLAYSGLSPRARRVAVGEALSALGLGGYEREPIFSLSGGEQQRVALARISIKRPAIVLADEPTAALDLANARVVLDLLRNWAALGSVVVVSTHDRNLRDQSDVDVELSFPAVH